MDWSAQLYIITEAFAELRKFECIQCLVKVLNTSVGRVYNYCRINKLNLHHCH